MSEVEHYEAEAAQTRERLRTSVEEMQRRLTPANIIQNARDSVRESVSSTVRDSGDAAVAQVRKALSGNPAVLAAVAVVLALVLYKRISNQRRMRMAASYADNDEYAAYSHGDSYVGDRNDRAGPLARGWTNVRSGVTSAGERLGEAGDRVRSSLDNARSSIGHAADGLAHSAGDNLRSAGRSVSSAASDAGHAAKRAVSSGGAFVRENPTAVVGLGLATGVLIAMLAVGDSRSDRWDDDEAFGA